MTEESGLTVQKGDNFQLRKFSEKGENRLYFGT